MNGEQTSLAESAAVLQVSKWTAGDQRQAARTLGLKRLKIGIIGYGYWGPNLVRNFAEIDGVELKWCADKIPSRRALVKRRYPAINAAEHADEILDDPEVDAVVIATPVTSHYLLVKRALERDKHVLVEKPMAQTVQECEELLELAEKKGLILMVDHTFLFTGAVRKMKEILEDRELGELHYFDSVRVNLGLFQHDIDVLWDLGPHDLSILNYLIQEPPKFVSATGADHTGSGLCDVVYMTVHFTSNFLVHCSFNWLSPVKIRQMLIGGSRRMLVYNDMEPSEKIRVYDRGVRVTTQEGIYNSLIDYRMGDVWAPKLDNREALAVECEHFVECVRFDKIPRTGAAAGLNVVRLLQAATTSLGKGGTREPI
jgi:predicted dehydrogenase